jgi:hypothetical protein
MEDLGCRVLTAQNGLEVLSIERAMSRFTNLVIPQGISGGEAGVGLFGKNVAGRRRPAERAAKLRAVLAGSTELSEADAFRKRTPARPAVALSGSDFVPKVAVSADRE